MSISDFGKPEAEPAVKPTISLTDPDVKPVVEQPKVEQPSGFTVETSEKTEEKSDFSVAKSETPSLGGGMKLVVNEPAATGPTQEEILQGILGKIGDGIGHGSKLKLLLYGDPGSMKSSLAATAPNNLVADLEDGLMSAKFAPYGVADNVRPYPWSNFEDFSNLIGAFMQNPPELDWVETFTMDTFSEVHRRALAEVTEREWRRRPGSVNRYVAETEHHVENNERMLRMIRALRGLNRNLIILTHATTVEPKGKPSKTYPDFSEKLANKIEGMMDAVGYCEKKVIEFPTGKKLCQVVRFQSDDGVHCKTRFPLPAEMINPSMADILKAWEESKTA